jgi:hypothetical protein
VSITVCSQKQRRAISSSVHPSQSAITKTIYFATRIFRMVTRRGVRVQCNRLASLGSKEVMLKVILKVSEVILKVSEVILKVSEVILKVSEVILKVSEVRY